MLEQTHRCSYCQQVFNVCTEESYDENENGINYVQWRSDPFQSEIHDDHTLMWLCDKCYYINLMEI